MCEKVVFWFVGKKNFFLAYFYRPLKLSLKISSKIGTRLSGSLGECYLSLNADIPAPLQPSSTHTLSS